MPIQPINPNALKFDTVAYSKQHNLQLLIRYMRGGYYNTTNEIISIVNSLQVENQALQARIAQLQAEIDDINRRI